jgi:hypothetical protein
VQQKSKKRRLNAMRRVAAMTRTFIFVGVMTDLQ